MQKQYSVSVRGKDAGKVLVKRQGLYYHFQCRCPLEEERMYRLVVTCGTHRENLGILVPEDGCFALNTKVPVKRLGEGPMQFQLTAKGEERTASFVPISPEEPFAYISRLKEAFLVRKNGQVGIYIEKMQEC